MLLVVNPHATGVSARLCDLAMNALETRYEAVAAVTDAPGHATELCRAAGERYDLVATLGGDGTINEAANGLVGSPTALGCLPGGATNVFCRTLGVPGDLVGALHRLLGLAGEPRRRTVDLGRVNERHFVFGSGIGLDASVVERVDRHHARKARFGEWYYTAAAIDTFVRRYLLKPPRVRVEAGGRSVEGVTVIVQSSDPFTYFGSRPIRIAAGAALGSGALAAAALTRATPLELPTVLPRVLSGNAARVGEHPRIEQLGRLGGLRVTTLDGAPFPVEVDGDYLGELTEASYRILPRALTVVA